MSAWKERRPVTQKQFLPPTPLLPFTPQARLAASLGPHPPARGHAHRTAYTRGLHPLNCVET